MLKYMVPLPFHITQLVIVIQYVDHVVYCIMQILCAVEMIVAVQDTVK